MRCPGSLVPKGCGAIQISLSGRGCRVTGPPDVPAAACATNNNPISIVIARPFVIRCALNIPRRTAPSNADIIPKSVGPLTTTFCRCREAYRSRPLESRSAAIGTETCPAASAQLQTLPRHCCCYRLLGGEAHLPSATFIKSSGTSPRSRSGRCGIGVAVLIRTTLAPLGAKAARIAAASASGTAT